MIYHFRLSKYDPTLRDEKGNYTDLSEWTGFDVVGKKYKGKVFTLRDYLLVENDYLAIIKKVCSKNKIHSMVISDLEFYPRERAKVFGFREMDTVPIEMVYEISRLILRSEMWCKFSIGKIYIHFGYDMYVYFSSGVKFLGERSTYKKFGNVYVEEFASPYLKT